MKNSQIIEKVSSHFAELMISKIESMKLSWQKPWFSGRGILPRNISGKNYTGSNIMTLLFLSELENFRTPIFLTFHQAKQRGLKIRKGSSMFPVIFWKPFYVAISPSEERPRFITVEEFRTLPVQEQQQYSLQYRLNYYLVLNLDQTDFAERYPEQWQKILDEQECPTKPEGLDNALMEEILACQTWVCPIKQVVGNQAFYAPAEDHIVVPMKSQFHDTEAFYSTVLHEMTHSTGIEGRLKRPMGADSYGREELVAEFSAALIGYGLGISSHIREENIAYLQGWLENIAQKPDFIFTILTDVQRVVRFFTETLHTRLFFEESQPEAAA